MLLQEHIPNAKEWRTIRIGGTYLSHQKGQIGDFHSGTNIVIFAEPPRKLLDFVRTVTDCGGFASIDVDIFETSDGRYLVNELQTLFGPDPIQMKVDGKPGRYIYDKDNDRWVFEEGVFAGDSCACCNLRVKYLLEQLAR